MRGDIDEDFIFPPPLPYTPPPKPNKYLVPFLVIVFLLGAFTFFYLGW